MSSIPTVELPGGGKMPQVGFGIAYKLPTDPFDQERADGILSALKVGYRHIDGAAIYCTDPEGGWAIANSGLDRSELFITHKTHPMLGIRRKDVEGELRKTLKDLGVDYVDLYLIHNPFFLEPKVYGIKEAWSEMERMKELGLTREIGVSNFEIVDLEKLLKIAKVKPAVNQIELHPNIYEASKPVIAFCKANSITIQGYGPLMTLGRGAATLESRNSHLPALLSELASKHSVTPAQILLKWQIQRGFVPITASMKPERQKAQIELTGWELEDDELEKIEEVGREVKYRLFGWGSAPKDVYESVL